MPRLRAFIRRIAPAVAVAMLAQTALAQRPMVGPPVGASRTGTAITPTAIPRPARQIATPPASTEKKKPYDQQRLMAGHLLRRMGFGPSREDMAHVLEIGRDAYIEEQLNPQLVDDSAAEARFYPVPDPFVDDFGTSWQFHWLTRMAYSRRQLLEKMTLIWHEHIPTSIGKIGQGKPMHDYEEMLRRNALGSFRQLLVDVTRDNSMLIYLDNNYNFALDWDGNPVPPNENYARELLQLFSLGTERLNMDGTPVVDENGKVLPNYTETDVREVARAMTGWYIEDYQTWTPSKFEGYFHDSGRKTFLGETTQGRSGPDGAHEIEDVVDVIMRHPSTAPFISKMLIQKLATETPTPGYVERVATVFKNTNGDIKATVRAILTDAEFTSDAVVRSQYKTPLEQFVGAVRGLGAETQGLSLWVWAYFAHHLPYYPPSVFSFYRPGKKGALVTASQVTFIDNFADDLVDTYTNEQYTDAYFDAAAMIQVNHLVKSKKTVDFLADRLLAAPLEPETRKAVAQYMGKTVSAEKLRGAVWLILTSPEYQLN